MRIIPLSCLLVALAVPSLAEDSSPRPIRFTVGWSALLTKTPEMPKGTPIPPDPAAHGMGGSSSSGVDTSWLPQIVGVQWRQGRHGVALEYVHLGASGSDSGSGDLKMNGYEVSYLWQVLPGHGLLAQAGVGRQSIDQWGGSMGSCMNLRLGAALEVNRWVSVGADLRLLNGKSEPRVYDHGRLVGPVAPPRSLFSAYLKLTL